MRARTRALYDDVLAERRRPDHGCSHERRLAIGALAQQLSGIASALEPVVAITVLARSLSLGELGTYGLLVSFATYLIFVQGGIEIAAVKAIAEAPDAGRRDEAFDGVDLYVVAGVAVGAVTAVAGIAALGLFDYPPACTTTPRSA